MKKLLMQIVKALVGKKEEVKITQTDAAIVTILTIDVAKDDIGKIVGKDGNTIRALTKLFKAISANQGKKCVLEIKDKEPANSK